jgi:hypothetical protein
VNPSAVNPSAVTDALEKLAAAQIQIVPAEIATHFILERDGFVAFVERRAETAESPFGNIGAAGLMTERGFAALIWRGDQAFFIGKGFEQPASPDEVQKIRAFASDLANALN